MRKEILILAAAVLLAVSSRAIGAQAVAPTLAEAEAALARVRIARPSWWAACGALGDQRASAQPRDHIIREV